MTYRMTFIAALACASALAGGPAAAVAVTQAGTEPVTVRVEGGHGTELTDLLAAHGIRPAQELAGEISREIIAAKAAPRTVALYRLPVRQAPAAVQARAAITQAGEPAAAQPARAIAPPDTPSPLRNALRRVLRLLKLLD